VWVSVYLAAAIVVVNPLTIALAVAPSVPSRRELQIIVTGLDLLAMLLAGYVFSRRHTLRIEVTARSAVSVVLALWLAAECGLRWVVLHDAISFPLIEHPGLFADSESEDDYWVLYARYSAAEYATHTGEVHPIYGWISGNGGALGVRSARYRDRGDIRGTPVLFFGDSYIAGATPQGTTIPDLLEELLPGTSVLNFGVGGYGTDQIALRVKGELLKLADANPIVLVGVLLNDMDRSLLTFRLSQKPYYTLASNALQLHLPRYRSNAEFLENYDFRTTSLVWRLMRQSFRRVVGSERGDPKRRQELNRAIFSDLCGHLGSADAPFRIVVLYDPRELRSLGDSRVQLPRERELKAIIQSSGCGVPIDTKAPILEAMRIRPLEDLALPDGHFDIAGNQLIARVVADEVRALR
jgi:hypothetical protein